MLSLTPGRDTEILCEMVIEALKELKPTTSEPVTPNLLHRVLSKKKEYLDLLGCAAGAREDGPRTAKAHRGGAAKCVKDLQDFRLDLLVMCEDCPDGGNLARAEALKAAVCGCGTVEEVVALNDELLAVVRDYSRALNGDLARSTGVVSEIGKDLTEMESHILSAFSHTREICESSKAFNNILENNVHHISESIHNSRNIAELRGVVAGRLSDIENCLESKRKSDERQLKNAADEIRQLKSRIRKMKKEIDRVRKAANSLEKKALVDSLTRTYNRRAYEEQIGEKLAEYNRSRQIFSLLLIDIDGFKLINDLHGHWAGDRCLEEVAKLIKVNLRGTDFLARYGGDEFIAVLAGTDDAGASVIREKLRKLIEKARFLYRNQIIKITISIGCATVRPEDRSAEDIFNRADSVLYEDKKGKA